MVRVCVQGGRWGPRRVRVTECVLVIKAEEIYTVLLRQGMDVRPGVAGRSLGCAGKLALHVPRVCGGECGLAPRACVPDVPAVPRALHEALWP